MTRLTKIKHSGFLIEEDGLRIVIDPFQAGEGMPVQVALVTHTHFDHLDLESLSRFVTRETIILAPHDAHSTLAKLQPKEIPLVNPGETHHLTSVTITTHPAYNLDKPYHPKANKWVGYHIQLPSGKTLYHAGDTDAIPELEGLQADIILLPVSGTYVMTAEEAASLAQRMKARVFIPMHYGVIVGSIEDAEAFARDTPHARILKDGETLSFPGE